MQEYSQPTGAGHLSYVNFDNDGNKDLYVTNGYGKNNTHMDAVMISVEQMMKPEKGEALMPKMGIMKRYLLQC